ncbi:MAG: hypothetical protein JXD19_03830 [Deltaproteobacteria bacterium]|nr:hypothetical protein [Deltaproteobacteria bacterium]
MIDEFQTIVYFLTGGGGRDEALGVVDPLEQFDASSDDPIHIGRSLNAAFLIILAGEKHSAFERAHSFLTGMNSSSEWGEIAKFYLKGKDCLCREVERVGKQEPNFACRVRALSDWIAAGNHSAQSEDISEKLWSVFFPEAVGIRENRKDYRGKIRKKRTVTITKENPWPITDPARQILFTANILLTVPFNAKDCEDWHLSAELKRRIFKVLGEPQLYWYDHPVQIGGAPEETEVLYGLRGLDAAVGFERFRSPKSDDRKVTCILSVSVTHRGLRDSSRRYLEELLALANGIRNIDLYAFTEADTDRIIGDVLSPAARRFLGKSATADLLQVFGVDGEYGRHYNFLKAIAALWKVFVDPEVRGTFKIDLDQVFPEEDLVRETGSSAFEHLGTPLWGATGLDQEDGAVELGMIAGALVNYDDINHSVFTPDVPFPHQALRLDEYIFYSILPQAISTEAEVVMRYSPDSINGKKTCLQRVHVTGGTTGILIDCLRRHRPFTPSFIGRAEDQAYIISVLAHRGIRLAYLHKDGLIMRHDKKRFAHEAIRSASVGKLLGDYVRILYFSAYVKGMSRDHGMIKSFLDPFTGCFVSAIPVTVVYLRFALKVASLFRDGQGDEGLRFMRLGVQRIGTALDFAMDDKGGLMRQVAKERKTWDLFYDTLTAIEQGLMKNDSFAVRLKETFKDIISGCLLRVP